jgi:small-conductance mechanosensitive channel
MTIVVLVLVSWFVFRDVFAGAIFRAQNDLSKGDYIKIGSISGQIKSLHLSYLELTADNGQNIKIPNSRLNQDLVTAMTTPEGMEEFTLSLSIDKRFEKAVAEEKIKYALANSPWCNYKNPPLIKFQKEDANAVTFDVMVYTLNQQHLRLVEKLLNDTFAL